MIPLTPSSECPCCSPPFEYGDFTRPWTLMKISNDASQVLWMGDYLNPTTLVVDPNNSRLYLRSGFFARTDTSFPTVIWTSNPRTVSSNIAVASNGDIVAAITTSSVLNFDRRTASDGAVWSVTPATGVTAVCLDPSGNIYGSRYVLSPNRAIIDKYDSSGTVLWSKQGVTSTVGIGGDNSIATNGTLLAAVSAVTTGGTPTTTRVFDITSAPSPPTSTAYLWTANHGVTVYGTAFLSNGNLITVGNRHSGSGKTTRCYDSSSGSQIWAVDHGTGVRGVAIDAQDNIYTTGVYDTTSKCTTRKYDSSGNLIWSFDYTQGFGAALGGVTTSISLDTDGYIYIGGPRFSP